MDGNKLHPEATHMIFIISGMPEIVKIDSDRYKILIEGGRNSYMIGSKDECEKVVQRVASAMKENK